MIITKLCLCCNKESEFYKNKNTGKISTHCSECNKTYSQSVRNSKELANVFKIILNSKEINEKCAGL